MRIAILTNEYPPNVYGGAGVHVEYLTRELARLEDGHHALEVLCFGEQSERIGRTRLWLLPSPSPTAGWNWESNKHWWRGLADEASLAKPAVGPA